MRTVEHLISQLTHVRDATQGTLSKMEHASCKTLKVSVILIAILSQTENAQNVLLVIILTL
jgi:hypothetical protein